MERGHEVSLTPTYTPMRTDEDSVAVDRIFFGAVNVYLQQKLNLFRHTPRFLDRLLDNRRLLGWVAKLGAASTNARMLGELTLSMLQGEEGKQKKELDRLAVWLEEVLHPEIVHLSFSLFSGFARSIKQHLGVPVVCSLQGEDLFLGELEEPYRTRVAQILRRRARDIDAFTVHSRYYAELMSREYGIPGDRIRVVRLGLNPEGYAAVERPAGGRAGAAGDEIVLGYLARFCPEKGAGQIIEAFRLLAEDPRLRLRLAGYLGGRDQAFYEEQKRRIAGWGLAGRVDFVGEVDRQGKIDFLSGLDVFSMPTVYREPKGLPVLEALAAGVPVVQPRHGAFPEWIESTGGGILVDPLSPEALAAGIRKLIEDPELRRRLGETGRAAALSRFDHNAAADDMLAVYREVLGERSELEAEAV
jgi:glycosyltransferase involved in cell wall biosynthesis